MSERPKLSRRQLLVATGLGAVAMSTDAVAAEERAIATEDDHRQVRLHDTDHVRTFYALARG